MKIAIWVLCMALAGCGASAREKTIAATLTTIDAASAGFVAFDARHQLDIVDKAKDQASGAAALTDWRKTQVEIESSLAVAYRAVALAATVNGSQSLKAMTQAAAIVAQELAALGVMP